MTTRAKRPAARAVPQRGSEAKAPPATDDVAEGVARIRDRNHQKDNIDAVREAAAAAVAKEMRSYAAATQPPAAPLLPRWMQATFAAAAGLVTLGALFGIGFAMLQSYSGGQVQAREVAARMAALESWRTEMTAIGIPAKFQQMENLTRTRDLQYADIKDQLIGLRQSDSAAGAQNQGLMSSIAVLTTQIESLRREMSEMKDQMRRGAFFAPQPRQNSEEAPARFISPLPFRIDWSAP